MLDFFYLYGIIFRHYARKAYRLSNTFKVFVPKNPRLCGGFNLRRKIKWQ